MLAQSFLNDQSGSLAERTIQFGQSGDAGVADLSLGGGDTASAPDTGSSPDLSLDAKRLEDLRQQFGLDRPLYQQYFTTLWAYIRFDFGNSLTYGRPVMTLVAERMPVLFGLGLVTFLFGTLITFFFGITKAYRQNTRYDAWTTTGFIALDAIPNLVLAIGLLTLFAAGGYFFQPDGLIPPRGPSLR